jgi:hypothetical protein
VREESCKGRREVADFGICRSTEMRCCQNPISRLDDMSSHNSESWSRGRIVSTDEKVVNNMLSQGDE